MAAKRQRETLEEWKRRRREAREARRLLQRAANLGRALKMRAARLLFEKTERSLDVARDRQRDPSTPLGTCAGTEGGKLGTETKERVNGKRAGAAVRSRRGALPEIHVGCSGWYYWHWKGLFYPDTIPRKDWFAWYARQFDTVELNAPFYSWPTLATVRTWLKQIPSDPSPLVTQPFVYTVKVCELITHVKRFVGTKTLVRDFGFIADLLGPRMGCFLFQLPPSFHYSEARLRRIVEQLDPARRNVVEFRHASWWNAAVYRAFRRAGIAFCSTSGPRLPDELVHTADDVYLRLHGTQRWYRHDYSAEELAVWVRRIRACGAKRVWAYFNNDRDGFAIKNARMLREAVQK